MSAALRRASAGCGCGAAAWRLHVARAPVWSHRASASCSTRCAIVKIESLYPRVPKSSRYVFDETSSYDSLHFPPIKVPIGLLKSLEPTSLDGLPGQVWLRHTRNSPKCSKRTRVRSSRVSSRTNPHLIRQSLRIPDWKKVQKNSAHIRRRENANPMTCENKVFQSHNFAAKTPPETVFHLRPKSRSQQIMGPNSFARTRG